VALATVAFARKTGGYLPRAIMDYFDHYKEAKELSETLHQENLNEYADGIIQSMEEGSTGTEIFMALRWNTLKILKSKNISKNIRSKAARLYKELNKALQ
jgi:hypothetical protein